MTLQVIGSSSKGNCYVLEAADGRLILEAGVEPREVKRVLGWNARNVQGVLCSHSHGDHAKYLASYASSFAVKCYALQETLDEVGVRGYYFEPIELGHIHSIGPFKVMPLQMHHDVPCAGFVVWHREMGKMLFATDTEYVEHVVRGCKHLLVECNYADDILEENILDGKVSFAMRPRLLHSHMEEKSCLRYISSHLSHDLRTVVLLHLSAQNSDAERFSDNASRLAGVPTYVARKGLRIELGL